MPSCFRPVPILFAAILVAAIASNVTPGSARAQDAPSFQMPLDCEIGVDCWAMRYFDHDPGPGTRDHECGFLTGDDHRGIDIRVRDFVAMYKGMTVVAAADGVVRATRDGITDVAVQNNPDSREEISRYGLGNTVIIDHGNGWETAYGHMLKGSVRVHDGEQVKAGQPLGMVGLSGLTTYPHVHFMVKYKGKALDPFTGLAENPGCGDTSQTLWTPEALAELRYIPTVVLIDGFADSVPTVEMAENGQYDQSALRPDGEAIAFWYHVMGLTKGDREEVRLTGPDGRVIAETERTAERNRVLAFGFIGDKLNSERLAPGTYRGEYRIVRSVNGIDQTVIDEQAEITVR